MTFVWTRASATRPYHSIENRSTNLVTPKSSNVLLNPPQRQDLIFERLVSFEIGISQRQKTQSAEAIVHADHDGIMTGDVAAIVERICDTAIGVGAAVEPDADGEGGARGGVAGGIDV